MDPRVKEYIRRELQRGFSKRSIGERLLKAGHDAKSVEQHLLVVMNELEEIDAKLIADIEMQAKKGMSREQIKQALIKAQHSEEKAEKHLWHVFGEMQGVNRELSKYIERKIDEGTAVGELRGKLIEAKHDKKEVDRQLKRHKISQYIQVGIAVVVVLVLVGSVVLYFFGDRTQEELDSAWELYRNGDYLGAIEGFEKASIKEGYQEDAYLGLGKSYQKLDEYDTAIQNFEKVVDMNPMNAGAYEGIGWSYYGKEDYEEAVGAFKKAYSIDSLKNTILHGLGLSYLRIGKCNESIELLTQIDSDEYLTEHLIYSQIGSAYILRAKDYEIALENFKKAVALEPSSSNYHGLAWSYYYLNEYPKAKENFDIAIELINPSDLDNMPGGCWWYNGLGRTYYQLGDSEKAKEYLQKSLATDGSCLIPENMEFLVE